ncbi:hypothetical protein [Winogradskyella vincentii]|uniref:Uncharacterized protein n=1 Tax=Winogradskyella vincentii TaxID=2877122 RepID=A0ABS7XZ72_9FLAO|nr:hypothetical protein [Winogradskyella vincentii]MCA0152963.1 hypothetical protein [Winogradskyella vincentii]
MNKKTLIKAIFKTLAIVLVCAVLLPSAVKLSHAYNHHEHFVCTDDVDHSTHFHQSDLDCEFYKFKLNNDLYVSFLPSQESDQLIYNKSNLSYYIFLRTHQQDTSYLRGPPSLV